MSYLDMFGNIPVTKADVQIFKAGGVFESWKKPRGCSMIYAMAIGAGSGGGAGFTGATATVRGGGGGGSSGGMSKLLVPAIFIPDTLHVYPGLKGLGGTTSGAAGTAGELSKIFMIPSKTAGTNDQLLASGAVAGAGGTGGSTGGSAAGGTAPTIAISSTAVISLCGISSFAAGVPGSAGGVVGGGNGITNTTMSSGPFGGGAGGGTTPAANTNFNGGFSSTSATYAGRTVTGVAGDAPGGAQLVSDEYFPFTFGGAGGGANGSGTGGRGGDGGPGSGGGGGGGGITFGPGGNGGDGLVIIIAW